MNIKCNAITKAYSKGNYGVRELSLQINSGEFLVVMGESGCGKSTLLRIISGIYHVDAGELFLDGVPANNIPPQDRDCAMIFQEYALYPNMTVYENVAFYLKKQVKLPKEKLEKRIMPILEFLGLKNFINVKPKFLSGGQQQRVCLAKALVRRPKLILFDEPLSNIDEKSRYTYLKLIKETKKLLPNSTFVYVTHNAQEAKFLADRIAIMLNGKIVDIGTQEELIKHPQYVDTMFLLAEDKVLNGDITDKFVADTENGRFEKELGEYEKETLDRTNLKGVYYSPDQFLNGYDTFFNANGKVISGYKKEVLLPATINDYNIDFQGQTLSLTDLQKERFIGKNGKVNIVIDTTKLHKTQTYGDFSVDLTYYKNAYDVTLFKVEDKIIVLKGEYSSNVTLYYNKEDLLLADLNGEMLSTKYAVYPNVTTAKVNNGTLYIGKSKLSCHEENGYYNVEIGINAFISVCDKQPNALKVVSCIGEDTLGKDKLVYLIVQGFDNYVTLKVPNNVDLFRYKNFYINLTSKEMKFMEI